MLLTTLGSGSLGNTYLLKSEKDILVIDAGVSFQKVKEATDFQISNIVGVLASHAHLDHAKYIPEYIKAGIEVYSSAECFDALNVKSHRAHPMVEQKVYNVGSFKVMAFPLIHDIHNLGFLIEHQESGKFVYITDSHYCGYTFKGLSNIIVECNYAIDIVDDKLLEGKGEYFIRNRVLGSHMELETTKEFLRSNDLSGVINIVLIHLSNENSDAKRFKKEIEELTGKTVHIAEPGLTIPFDETAF